jgi:hypothetical protein
LHEAMDQDIHPTTLVVHYATMCPAEPWMLNGDVLTRPFLTTPTLTVQLPNPLKLRAW